MYCLSLRISYENDDSDTNSEETPSQDRLPTIWLGGTCNGSQWRAKITELLKYPVYNPEQSQWTDEDAKNEISIRNKADVLLYVLTPKHKGYYTFMELGIDGATKPEKTFIVVLPDEDGEVWGQGEKETLDRIQHYLETYGATFGVTLEEIAQKINEYLDTSEQEEEGDVETDEDTESSEEETEEDSGEEEEDETPGDGENSVSDENL